MLQNSYAPYFQQHKQDSPSSLPNELETENYNLWLTNLREQPSQLYELVQDRPHYVLQHEARLKFKTLELAQLFYQFERLRGYQKKLEKADVQMYISDVSRTPCSPISVTYTCRVELESTVRRLASRLSSSSTRDTS